MRWYSNYSSIQLTGFLERLDAENWYWVIKRLSGNDTGLTGGHQSGVYLPRIFFEALVPDICRTDVHNPKVTPIACYFPDTDTCASRISATYYNSKYFPEKKLKKKYDEFRLTGWGGRGAVPLQDEDQTGAIAVIAGRRIEGKLRLLAWVCTTPEDEVVVESWVGRDLFPGDIICRGHIPILDKGTGLEAIARKCILQEWLKVFPSGEEIFSAVLAALPHEPSQQDAGALLLKRRALEFMIFSIIEQEHVHPLVAHGFKSVDTFLELALSVANRRKSRTGRSLELNLAAVFTDMHLLFEEQVVTENNKKPDFLFPSGSAYHDPTYPVEKLFMLGAKTCCKERWRQICTEANRIWPKHLFTLQEGVSRRQIEEMNDSSVVLVVPRPNISKFAPESRASLLDLQAFAERVRMSQR